MLDRTKVCCPFFLLAILCPAMVWAAPLYSVTDLGQMQGASPLSHAYGINNLGHVVGDSINRPFIWTPEQGMQPLTSASGVIASGYAWDINDHGQVVGAGSVGGGGGAYVWTAATGIQHIVDPATGQRATRALGINNAGQIAGTTRRSREQAFIWDPVSGFRTLSTAISSEESLGREINEQGQVIGDYQSRLTEPFSAALWTGVDQFVNLGDLASGQANGQESQAMSINDHGQVVGYVDYGRGVGTFAALWESDGTFVNLGALPGTRYSVARDINEIGQIVGVGLGTVENFEWGYQVPVLWLPDGTFYNLNDLLDESGANWYLVQAEAINDHGQIVGVGVSPGGSYRALLLTPVPEPAAICSALLGAIALGIFSRVKYRN